MCEALSIRPKRINIIWVGDESKRPDRLIDTWRTHYDVRVLGNEDMKTRGWVLGDYMRHYAKRDEWNGVADCMRWELLWQHGGVFVDADSELLAPLPEWLWDCEFACCYENEKARPGLLACGMLAAKPNNTFVKEIIESILSSQLDDRLAWEVVATLPLSQRFLETAYDKITVLPSHMFIPEHFTGAKYTGSGPIYARQHWGSTRHSYGSL